MWGALCELAERLEAGKPLDGRQAWDIYSTALAAQQDTDEAEPDVTFVPAVPVDQPQPTAPLRLPFSFGAQKCPAGCRRGQVRPFQSTERMLMVDHCDEVNAAGGHRAAPWSP